MKYGRVQVKFVPGERSPKSIGLVVTEDGIVIKGALYSSYKAFQNIVCFALKEILWSLN